MLWMTCQPHWKPSSEFWKQRLKWGVSKVLLLATEDSTHAARPFHMQSWAPGPLAHCLCLADSFPSRAPVSCPPRSIL